MSDSSVALLHGSLSVLVFQTLSWGPIHGFGIARWIRRRTGDALQLEEGSRYPALYCMENRGWIKGGGRTRENNRRADQDHSVHRAAGVGNGDARSATSAFGSLSHKRSEPRQADRRPS